MKRFQFSLETVHNLRELQRDEAERQLGQAAAVVLAAIGTIEEIEGLRTAAEAKLAGTTGPLCAADLVMQVNYLEVLAKREREARTRLAALEHEREERRQSAVTAAREAEVTGQLRERQHARHRAESERVEQSLLDEMAVAAVQRRGQGRR